ncbi:uncharacterized protein LOC131639923 [Vicia villosa]|uniref:uncharacterized protein LOC131639923 n=1 Tax=Vicia villosa TaxID=3911 RepID=UPI00273B0C36|nr:uncharacterized protein LOC131639923 [Vicia villosa]
MQEEKQRVVNAITSNNSENLAYAVAESNGSKSKNGRRDRPLCSHCNVLGHTKDKCFKLHGYPPGFKKGKVFTPSQPNANAVNTENMDVETPLNTKQYQQLIAYIQGQMARQSNTDPTPSDSVGHSAGEGDWFG